MTLNPQKNKNIKLTKPIIKTNEHIAITTKLTKENYENFYKN